MSERVECGRGWDGVREWSGMGGMWIRDLQETERERGGWRNIEGIPSVSPQGRLTCDPADSKNHEQIGSLGGLRRGG